MAHWLRSLARAVALVVAAALVLTPAAAFAQDLALYDSIVDRYVADDANGAVDALSRWSRDDVASAAKRWSRLTSARVRAAVMLHTDFAFAAMLAGTPDAAGGHLAASQMMVDGMVRRDRGSPSTSAFAQRWYEFVASLYTAQGLLDDADWVIRTGLSQFPRDPMLYVARGIVQKTRITLNRLNPRGSGLSGPRPPLIPARLLDLAAADFRRALAIDPALAIASLHLGWLHLTTGDSRASQDLDEALATAADEDVRYLVRLLRGAVAERGGRLESAREEYEAAIAVGAAYQTAYVALSRAEEALGHSGRARAIAQAYALLTDKRDDPWWDFRIGGFNSGALRSLRAEVRR